MDIDRPCLLPIGAFCLPTPWPRCRRLLSILFIFIFYWCKALAACLMPLHPLVHARYKSSTRTRMRAHARTHACACTCTAACMYACAHAHKCQHASVPKRKKEAQVLSIGFCDILQLIFGNLMPHNISSPALATTFSRYYVALVG